MRIEKLLHRFSGQLSFKDLLEEINEDSDEEDDDEAFVPESGNEEGDLDRSTDSEWMPKAKSAKLSKKVRKSTALSL